MELTTAITTVGIVTRNRLTSLTASLESYLDNCRRYDRQPDFVISDDSPAADVGHSTRAALRLLGNRFGARIRYAGLEERSRFAAALARESGVPLEIVRFGLLGDDRCAVSTGANRNSLLLDTVGEVVLSVDDDTVCRIAVPPDGVDAPSSLSEYDPTEFWFFPDRATALEAGTFVEMDVLRCHDAMLGRSALDAGAPGDPRGHVAITLHGLIGDSGMGSPRYYLTLTGGSRARLVASADGYRSAFLSREVLRTVRRPTITAGPFCMTTCFGFDHRVLLPPFFPVQRNADGIFGLVLQHCIEGSRVGFLPFALVHAPAIERTFEPDAIWTDARRVRMADIILASVLTHDAGSPQLTDADRLVGLGRHLRSLGSLTLTDFEARVRSLQQHRVVAFVTALQSQLQTYAASPDAWAEDVNRMIAVMPKAVGDPDYIVPRDLCQGRDIEDARLLSRELVVRFGELLEAWPSIVSAATRLRTNGYRLTDLIQGAAG